MTNSSILFEKTIKHLMFKDFTEEQLKNLLNKIEELYKLRYIFKLQNMVKF